MPKYVENAIEIITDDGRGIVVGYSNTAIGLATDGHFALITGRPTISSVTGDTTRTAWYRNILAQDPKSYLPFWAADFIEGGCFQEVSSLQFSIKNTSAFYKVCEDHGVYLTGCRVIYYEVTSEDGAVWNFDRQWTGKIGDQPFDELTYRVKCKDDSRDIFKYLPIQSVNDASFENAKDKDKMIPIAIGRVAKSPLVSVSESGKKTDLCVIDSVYHQTCAAYAKISTSISLFTSGFAFNENDYRLVGKYLIVAAVGPPQAIRIVSNSKTAHVVGSPYSTTVTLAEELKDWPGAAAQYTDINNTSALIWYFQVSDIAQNLVASQKPISEFVSSSNGIPGISIYDSEKNRYEDVSEVLDLFSVENIASTGHPGITAASDSAEVGGSLISYTSIHPTAIKVNDDDHAEWTTDDLPAVGADAPILYDGLGSNFYTFTKTVGFVNAVLKFDIELPKDNDIKVFDELYLLLDFSHFYSTLASDIRIVATVSGLDIYGRTATTSVSAKELYGDGHGNDASLGTAVDNRFALPKSYYNTTGDDGVFYAKKASLNISSLISDTKKTGAYNRVRLTIGIASLVSNSTYTFRLHQIGVVAKRTVGVGSENIYSSLIGETFGTTWGGRMIPGNPILTLPDAIEHLVRNYDISAETWRAGQAVTVGKKIRGTADNNHVFICTVAGKTHATTEPTWTTTAGATYTDGTVTWKQFMEIPIDITSFNSLGSRRGTWFVGRTLTEKKKSFDYYKQLFQQGFLIGMIDRFGKLKCKAWLDEATPLLTFDSTNIIPGTLEEMESSLITLAYTEILVRYDWNPGAEKFNKQISVTKADEPAFPAPNETTGIDTDLGAFSIQTGGSGSFPFQVGCDSPHGLSTGDYVSLYGNADGYDFGPRQISVLDANYFYVEGHPALAPISSSGELLHHSVPTIKWKTFVTGIANYAFARDELWNPVRAAFIQTKTINKLPSELGDCHWYIDPYAKDPNGAPLWPDLDVGDDHPAANYAKHLCNWSAWPKKMPNFRVPNKPEFRSIEVGGCVNFNDEKQTAGLPLLGWVWRKSKVSRDDESPECWMFGLILMPERRVDRLILDENLPGGDIYDENSPGGDIYDENIPGGDIYNQNL